MQKITIQLSPYMSVTVDGEHETQLFRQAAFWAELPTECPVCGSRLVPTFRTPQSFTYYGLRCIGTPSHSVNLGEAKETHNLYFDKTKPWTIWGSSDPITPERSSPAANARLDVARSEQAAGGENFSLKPPPGGHPNDPNSVRGKMITAINDMRVKALKANIDLSEFNDDFNGLGGKSDEDIATIGRRVRNKVESAAINQ
jgi:hypothetical protein